MTAAAASNVTSLPHAFNRDAMVHILGDALKNYPSAKSLIRDLLGEDLADMDVAQVRQLFRAKSPADFAEIGRQRAQVFSEIGIAVADALRIANIYAPDFFQDGKLPDDAAGALVIRALDLDPLQMDMNKRKFLDVHLILLNVQNLEHVYDSFRDRNEDYAVKYNPASNVYSTKDIFLCMLDLNTGLQSALRDLQRRPEVYTHYRMHPLACSRDHAYLAAIKTLDLAAHCIWPDSALKTANDGYVRTIDDLATRHAILAAADDDDEPAQFSKLRP